MRHTRAALAAAVLLAFSAPFAVTWRMDSNQFAWPGSSSVAGKSSAALSRPVLQWRTDAVNGSVVIRYAAPSAIGPVKLTIHDVKGAKIRSFDLRPGDGAVRWNFAGEHVPAGMYIACLRFGSVVKNAQIPLDK